MECAIGLTVGGALQIQLLLLPLFLQLAKLGELFGLKPVTPINSWNQALQTYEILKSVENLSSVECYRRLIVFQWTPLRLQQRRQTSCINNVINASFVYLQTCTDSLAYFKLVAWHSGRTSVFGRRTFPVLRSTRSWWVTTYVGKPSAIGQPTRPTKPFILSRLIN